MKVSHPLAFAIAAILVQHTLADLPKVAFLKLGEKLDVSMTLYGYTITQTDFSFTSEKVAIRSKGNNLGELVLTDEEKTKVDEYLNSIRLAEGRRTDEEGYTYSVAYSRNQQTENWKFMIFDARESSKPTLSLHELRNRLEEQRKKREFENPADGYFRAYLLIGEAEKEVVRRKSIRLLQEAVAQLQAVKSRFPEWKAAMVNERIQQTQELLAGLSTAGY